jgi:hypothetical protein
VVHTNPDRHQLLPSRGKRVLDQQSHACRTDLLEGVEPSQQQISAELGSAVPAAHLRLTGVNLCGADLLNEDFRRCQYAVRGELYLAAENLRKAGREIIFTNVGNPQALGQKPITFNRQVTAAHAACTCSCRSSLVLDATPSPRPPPASQTQAAEAGIALAFALLLLQSQCLYCGLEAIEWANPSV